ncbi:MAG: uracil-DNA glycosylase [Deltaproteobacteria bacterium]|nr:uracil-DNA glycosylase [Candidatus Anaeroferrophillus wilburensis]MBN2889707.1 uracil-DNA glycosylase [Deltaproteobacteria bacterium]
MKTGNTSDLEQLEAHLKLQQKLKNPGILRKVVDKEALMAHIEKELGDCQRCPLAATRTTIVFGAGSPEASLMFVGEAPGRDEDREGIPFVGRAGQLLTRIIEAINLTRDQVYIANILKCRPPNNRNPENQEILQCYPFLERQIAAIQPRIICALGTFAAQTLLQTSVPIGKLRGHPHQFSDQTLVIPTYHPAFLLRNPNKKRDVWEDMQLVMRLLAEKA